MILVSIGLFLYLLRDLPKRTACNLGFVYGLTFGLGTMYWLFVVFPLQAFPLICLMAMYFALLSFVVASTKNCRPVLRAIVTAIAAIGIEWLRGDAWYLRFPWYTPPHALACEPVLIGSARWLGTYGLSLAVWFFVAWGICGRRWYWLGLPILLACGWLLPSFSAPDQKALLIQAEGEEAMEEVTRQIPKTLVNLVVMPEYAYHRSVPSVMKLSHGPKFLASQSQAAVVFGAVDGEYGTKTFYNIAAVIDAAGNILGTFPKQHPVPLMLDGIPGNRRPVFAVEGGTLGVAVCYDFDAPEVASYLVRQGATVLVSPTFDALWWTEIQHVHHELLARLRAVENDRWLLRCVSSGRTEVINPHGVPSAEGIAIGEKGYIVLPFAHRATFTMGQYTAFLDPLVR